MRSVRNLWFVYQVWCRQTDECAVILSPVLFVLASVLWYGAAVIFTASPLEPASWVRAGIELALLATGLHAVMVLRGFWQRVPSHRRFKAAGSFFVAGCCFTPIFFLRSMGVDSLDQLTRGLYLYGMASGIQLGFIFLVIAARTINYSNSTDTRERM